MPSPEKGVNRLVIAAAGSGKTRHIVRESIAHSDGHVLITTYTEANEAEIRKRFIEECRCVPGHVTVQTWYSFLIQHGARPFQGSVPSPEIKGLVIPTGRSAQGIAEANVARHYFTSDRKIYSDKLAKFAIKCNTASGGAVVDRLSRINKYVFVDEVQDISGYDLDFLKLILQSSIDVTLVGDPRQSVYATSNVARNQRFRGSQVVGFFEDPGIEIEKDLGSLTVNHRCVQPICDISNRLFPSLPAVQSGQIQRTEHDGIFLVALHDVDAYLDTFRPVQLRYRADSRHVRAGHPAYNFGLSKGMEFDRVLIFPTEDMLKWLEAHTHGLAPETRAKFYVALTRARFSVGIVTDQGLEGIIPRFADPRSSANE